VFGSAPLSRAERTPKRPWSIQGRFRFRPPIQRDQVIEMDTDGVVTALPNGSFTVTL